MWTRTPGPTLTQRGLLQALVGAGSVQAGGGQLGGGRIRAAVTNDHEPMAANNRDYLLTVPEVRRSKSGRRGAALPPEAPGEGPSSLSSFSGLRESPALWPHRPQFCLLLTGPFSPPLPSPSACLLQGHLSLDSGPIQDALFSRSLPQSPLQRRFLQIGSHSQAQWTRLLGPSRCPHRWDSWVSRPREWAAPGCAVTNTGCKV